MTGSSALYRVKVLVDGRWVSTGDFHVLEQAQERARLMAVHLERRVEIRDADGELVHREVPPESMTSPADGLDEESSRSTVILD